MGGKGIARHALRLQLCMQRLADLEAVGGAFTGRVDAPGHARCVVGQRGLHLRAFGGREGRLHAAQALLQRHLAPRGSESLVAGVQHQLASGAVIALRTRLLQPGVKARATLAR